MALDFEGDLSVEIPEFIAPGDFDIRGVCTYVAFNRIVLGKEGQTNDHVACVSGEMFRFNINGNTIDLTLPGIVSDDPITYRARRANGLITFTANDQGGQLTNTSELNIDRLGTYNTNAAGVRYIGEMRDQLIMGTPTQARTYEMDNSVGTVLTDSTAGLDGVVVDKTTGGFDVGNNAPPVVNAGANKTANGGDSVTMTASASDPDGDPLNYTWSVLEGVPGSFTNPRALNPDYTPQNIDGDVILQLAVNDEGVTITDTVQITVTAVSLPSTVHSFGYRVYVGDSQDPEQFTELALIEVPEVFAGTLATYANRTTKTAGNTKQVGLGMEEGEEMALIVQRDFNDAAQFLLAAAHRTRAPINIRHVFSDGVTPQLATAPFVVISRPVTPSDPNGDGETVRQAFNVKRRGDWQ